LAFCQKYKDRKFYQPVIFVPNIIEIQGKWHNDTKKLANIVLENVKSQNILDLGCSTGFFLCESKLRGSINCVGIDHDKIEIDIAQEINQIISYDINFMHADIECFFANSIFHTTRFDTILMFNVLHVLKDPSAVIKRFLDLAGIKLIIEHETKHIEYFPVTPTLTIQSPRCAGKRLVSFFNKR